jgi:hypothetical protein
VAVTMTSTNIHGSGALVSKANGMCDAGDNGSDKDNGKGNDKDKGKGNDDDQGNDQGGGNDN